MEHFYLNLFIGTTAALLLSGLRHPTGIYQYPFLMGAIFGAFLVPQAIALVDNPGVVPTSAVSGALLMGVLCMLMAWLGYAAKPMRVLIKKPVRPLKGGRVRFAAIVVMAISLLAVFGMTRVEAGSTGLFTILSFFSGLSVISFTVFLAIALTRSSWKYWVLVAVAGYPLYMPALGGRRSEAAAFIIIVAIMLFFRRGILPARWMAVTAVVLAAYLIPVFAEIRGQFWAGLFSGDFSEIPWKEAMEKVLVGDILELRNAAAVIDALSLSGIYGWGTGYWDAIIFRYVPGQLVGFDLKNGLMFGWTTDLFDVTGFQTHTGTTLTAIGDTFRQFGYFGALFFFLQGYMFKNLWYLAVERRSFMAQLAYVGLATPALAGVTHGSSWFVQGALIIVLVLFATYRFARVSLRRSAKSLNDRNALVSHRRQHGRDEWSGPRRPDEFTQGGGRF